MSLLNEQFRYFLRESLSGHRWVHAVRLCSHSSLPSVMVYMHPAEHEAGSQLQPPTLLPLTSAPLLLLLPRLLPTPKPPPVTTHAPFLFTDPRILVPSLPTAPEATPALPQRIKNSFLRAESPVLLHKGHNKCRVTHRMYVSQLTERGGGGID